MLFKTKKAALAFIGGLSKPSKMPCKGWSLPAFRCKIGTKLRAVINSVCSKCYAHKGMYVFPKVRACLERRFGILERALSDEMFREMFRAAFVRLLRDEEFFRWLDSGDIQSVAHLLLMADIARDNPHVTFWLPTRERNIVLAFMRKYSLPANLTVRVSAPMIDGAPLALDGLPTSTVHKKGQAHGTECVAYTQGGFCLDCRACWNRDIANISYPAH
jgi:hypothetical protein